MVLVPSRRRNHNFVELEVNTNQHQPTKMNRLTSIIFWNVRGARNDDFRRNFRELIDTYRPCMVALLETRMTTHATLLNNFNFSELIEVPIEGQAGDMAILYNHNLIMCITLLEEDKKSIQCFRYDLPNLNGYLVRYMPALSLTIGIQCGRTVFPSLKTTRGLR